ncbi:hypothetical protein [Longimicrobium sp.]|uniref:hypothetical protein n=1 Tax=Longimicrobium sp. TaxID=2029185 RepID=UPI002BF42A03|nr:hypothetical protein [Longimicrobium sp.]HSU14854.1 hypothetical protein [Longimicrobium sp.]
MNKMRLNVDGLSVESFPTGERPAESQGTVHANWAPTNTGGNCATCGGATCFTSCAGAGGHCTCPIL